MIVLMFKSDQLARIPTLVSGHTRADGTAVAPHMGLRTKRVPQAAPSAPVADPLEAYVAKHGGYDRLRYSMGSMTPEQRAKLVDAMAHLGGVEPTAILQKLGLMSGDIGRDEPAPERSPPPVAEPAEVAGGPTTDPEVEDAEDREDLASAMSENPHSDRSKSIIGKLAERIGLRRPS